MRTVLYKENLRERVHVEDLGIEVILTLKPIFKK